MLNDLPLNTDSYYVMAKCGSGCEVYTPIKTEDEPNIKKEQLRKYLEDY